MKPARVIDLGAASTARSGSCRRSWSPQRQAGEIADTLLLVEHPDVITLGRRQSSQANVVDAGDIPIFEIERGGDVTYHGPGQLVGYPILELDDDERDLHAYLRNLEEALIGVCARPRPRRRGASRDGPACGSASARSRRSGIAVRRWVTCTASRSTSRPTCRASRAINPCGLDAAVMTSLSQRVRARRHPRGGEAAGHRAAVRAARPRVRRLSPPAAFRAAATTGTLYRELLAHAAALLPPVGRLVWISPRGDETVGYAEPLGLRCMLRRRGDMARFWGELQAFTRGSRAATRFGDARPGRAAEAPAPSAPPPRARRKPLRND